MGKRKIDWSTVFLSTVTLALALVAFVRSGPGLALTALKLGGDTLLSVTPLLLAAFLIAGLTQVLSLRQRVERRR